MNDRFSHSSTMSKQDKPAAPADSPNFFPTPPTVFPQYTSAWAGLPAGVLGNSSPAPATQPGAPKVYYPVNPLGPYSGPVGTPSPAPPSTPGRRGANDQNRGWRGFMGGLMGGDYASAQISSLPENWQNRINTRWGVIGNGAPLPATLGDYRAANRAWNQAHPEPPGSWLGGFNGWHR